MTSGFEGVRPTEMLFLVDSYLRSTEAQVVAVDGDQLALDQTVCYPTGGGQPHDTGVLRVGERELAITKVAKKGEVVWHTFEGPPPSVGETVSIEVNWERRHQLMRTHSAMHVLCGVIWNQYGKAVTGGNMEPLAGRMDFEFDPLPDDFAETITSEVNAAIAANYPIEVSFLDRDVALKDDDLIRTKVNLIPESVTNLRIVDIVGLDKQADGGTHVAATAEIGQFEVVKTESKGKGNKRVRIRLT